MDQQYQSGYTRLTQEEALLYARGIPPLAESRLDRLRDRLHASRWFWRVRRGMRFVGWALLIVAWHHMAALYEYGWFLGSEWACQVALTLAFFMVSFSVLLGWPPFRFSRMSAGGTWLVSKVKRLLERGRP